MQYVIVGARGEAGQSALEAIKAVDREAHIFATTSSDRNGPDGEQPGLSWVGNIDLNAADAPDRVQQALHAAGVTQPAVLFYTPALGPIGYPVRAATRADVMEALRFSYIPMVALAERLRPAKTVGYSAFYWLRHTLGAYGSMAYAKIALDRLAFREPEKYRVIRAGTFASQATRGIALLMYRKIRKTEYPELQELAAAFQKSDKKFSDFFFEYAYSCEIEAYAARFDAIPHRPTNRADLLDGNRAILNNAVDAPVQSMIGDWRWTET
ncbi:MAG: hypothetical protein KDK34_13405, partial [Leptospiraceae bacterium]|nr:hypothetical protein [Leptospiraceae bacterium]